MSFRFLKNVVINGKIECKTGLHIGGTEEGYEIGGMDNPVIKDKITGYPYIPGSSLKGKMRSLTEWALGKVTAKGEECKCASSKCPVCRIFGTSAAVESKEDEKRGPTRLVVRDIHVDVQKMTQDGYIKGGGFQFEIKTENSLNRITSAANPRPMERVPRGTCFDFEMIYSIYDMGDQGERDIENLDHVFSALKLVEASCLGGGGSRGSGEVRFIGKKARIKTLDDYRKEAEGVSAEPGTVIDLEEKDSLDKLRQYLRNVKREG